VSRKWRNWYQNEVDEEIKGADSRDKVKQRLNVISDTVGWRKNINYKITPHYHCDSCLSQQCQSRYLSDYCVSALLKVHDCVWNLHVDWHDNILGVEWALQPLGNFQQLVYTHINETQYSEYETHVWERNSLCCYRTTHVATLTDKLGSKISNLWERLSLQVAHVLWCTDMLPLNVWTRASTTLKPGQPPQTELNQDTSHVARVSTTVS